MRSAGYFCATLERSAILTANCAAVSVGFTLSSSNARKCLSITPPKCFWQRRMSLTIPHMPRHTTSSRVVVIYARDHLVPHFINTATFATRDFWPRRGASDAHTLQGSVRSEQRRRGQKEPSPGGLRAFRFWLRCSSVTAPLRGMLPRRASPEPKIDATNVVVFMKRGT